MKEERPSDLELDRAWKKFLAGDDESFNLLYNRYVQVLFSYGLQFISDRELLKDCIQDTFVKMYDAREHLHHVSNVNVYLRITLKNRLINILNRERMYSRIISIQDILPVDENTIEKHIVFEEEELQKQDKIEKMMNLLTAQQKKVVCYRYVEDMSLEEISLHLGVNYQSVQNTLQRAIKKIKKHFPSEK